MFSSINPFTEERFNETPLLSYEELNSKLDLSHKCFATWRSLLLDKKIAYVQNLKAVLDREKKVLANSITKEMGKPFKQSLAEIEKCIWLCEYGGQKAPDFLKEKHSIPLAPENAYVMYEPLGVILGIMPWNFPFWQVFRFAIPVILSGNTVLIKHAPNVMLCAAELERVFLEAGFPVGVYQNLPVSIEQTEKVIKDSRLKGVSFTGSVKAGRSVARLAGQYLKKNVLELGGNDPYLILDSADLDKAVKEGVLSRMNNSGQSCISAKRFIVTKKNKDQFIHLLQREMENYKMGDPLCKETNLGPLARKDLREHLHNQVNDLIRQGAKLLLGGYLPKGKGYFYPPSILSQDVLSSDDTSFDEELFGPVALVINVPDEETAFRVANHSSYGLGAAIFSQDMKKAEEGARNRLQAGSCVVNKALHSHPALPFGGIKDSGYGRELSFCGFYEFVNVKTIQVCD